MEGGERDTARRQRDGARGVSGCRVTALPDLRHESVKVRLLFVPGRTATSAAPTEWLRRPHPARRERHRVGCGRPERGAFTAPRLPGAFTAPWMARCLYCTASIIATMRRYIAATTLSAVVTNTLIMIGSRVFSGDGIPIGVGRVPVEVTAHTSALPALRGGRQRALRLAHATSVVRPAVA